MGEVFMSDCFFNQAPSSAFSPNQPDSADLQRAAPLFFRLQRQGKESALHSILDEAQEGIMTLDLAGYITFCNKAAGRLLGFEPKALLTSLFRHRFNDLFFGFSMKQALSLRAEKHSFIRCRDQKLAIRAVFFNDAMPLLCLFIKDITEIEKLKETHQDDNRLIELGKNTATAAHEIRNPLGAIRGFAALLYRDLENFNHLREMAGYILEGTKKLEHLLNNILILAKPLALQLEICEIGPLLQDICHIFRQDPSFPDKVHLTLHLTGSIFAPIDIDALSRALLNLLTNARQATGQEGAITLSLMQNNDFCEITIADTGCGITEEDQAQMFSLFFSTKKQGSGIGLFEVKKIIEAHFGQIEFRSQERGSAFIIKLPMKK